MATLQSKVQALLDTTGYPTLYVPEKSAGLQMWIKPQEVKHIMLQHLLSTLGRADIYGVTIQTVKRDKAITHFTIKKGNETLGTIKNDSSMIKVVETPFTRSPVKLHDNSWLVNDATHFIRNKKPFSDLYCDSTIDGVYEFISQFEEMVEWVNDLPYLPMLQILPVVEEDKLVGLTAFVGQGDTFTFTLFK